MACGTDRVCIAITALPRDQDSTVATQLDEIVVTATKTEKNVADAPGSITVINARNCRKKTSQTVDDALNTIPVCSSNAARA